MSSQSDARDGNQRPESDGNGGDDYYGIHHTQSDAPSESTGAFDDVLGVDTEPADPATVDHVARRQTPIAPEYFSESKLPRPLVECGCDDCPDRVDPLADECDGAFGDLLDRTDYMAAEECPDPRPMTVQRAATAYYVYQTAAQDRDDWTSRLGRVRNQHGIVMDAERDLLERWDGEVSTALLSLRLRPVEVPPFTAGGDNYGITDTQSDSPVQSQPRTGLSTVSSQSDTGGGTEDDDYGPIDIQSDSPTQSEPDKVRTRTTQDTEAGRRWIPPIELDNRLHSPLKAIRQRLRYHLGGYDYEYLWVVGATDSAATPHLHVYVWVRDPDDEVTVDHVRPAVETFTNNTVGAHPHDHPVADGDSGAAVVHTDPPRVDEVDEDQLIYIFHERGDEGFELNTRGLHYLLNQRPDWVLKRLSEGESTFDDERVALEGAAIAWATPNDWIGSSSGIDLSN